MAGRALYVVGAREPYLIKSVDAEKRKLLGMDAATKVESTATVRYEVAGVDLEDLS